MRLVQDSLHQEVAATFREQIFAGQLAPGLLAHSLSGRLTLFAALKSRDSEGAEAAMRAHRTRQREALRQLARSQRSRLSS